MVVIFFPATLDTGVTHARIAWPLLWTVQAPHCAIPHPNFVPVSPKVSRRTHSSGICGTTSTVCVFPLRVNRMPAMNSVYKRSLHGSTPVIVKYQEMRAAFCLLSVVMTARAGVIRGVVLEHASGLPLARSNVRLEPVPAPGSTLKGLQMRAGTSGQFVFNHVPDGLWVLIVTRDSYFPASYQQRRPDGQGKPIQVTAESDVFTELRMFRKGAITGRVLDENGIGMEDVPVVAYRARLPIRAAGRAVSDDRGVYRIHGLDPGKYWVRTAAHTLDDGTGRMPTFGPETFETREAHTHQAVLDRDTTDADVRPFPGRLFHLRGRLLCEGADPVTVTLSSETGRRSATGACGAIPFSYGFEELAPGAYEILATRVSGEAGYVELSLDRDTDNATLQLLPPPSSKLWSAVKVARDPPISRLL